VLGHFNAGFSPQDFTASLVLQADPQLRFKPATRSRMPARPVRRRFIRASEPLQRVLRRSCWWSGRADDADAPSEIGRNLLRASYLAGGWRHPWRFAGVFGKIAQAYFQKYGDQSDALAMIAPRTTKNGVANP